MFWGAMPILPPEPRSIFQARLVFNAKLERLRKLRSSIPPEWPTTALPQAQAAELLTVRIADLMQSQPLLLGAIG